MSNLTSSVYFKSFSQHRKHSYYYTYEKYLSVYPMVLIVIGTMCNLTSFYVMHRQNMRKHSCMRYLSILSLFDIIVLYQWNLNTFFKYNLSVPPLYSDLEEISLFWCRWISFFAFSSLQISAWLLSLVSFDRFMIISSSWWRSKMSKEATVKLIIYGLVAFFLLFNSHILFLNGYMVKETKSSMASSANASSSSSSLLLRTSVPPSTLNYLNMGTTIAVAATSAAAAGGGGGPATSLSNYQETIVCYKRKDDPSYIFPKWETVHSIVYNFIPFTIMFFCNSMIIYDIKFAQKLRSSSKQSAKKKTRTSLMLVIVTFSFMTLTLPSVIVHTFFREFLSNKPYRRLVNLIVNNLLHTSHAIDFFLYVFTAPNFRVELSNFLTNLCHWRKGRSDASTANAAGTSVPLRTSMLGCNKKTSAPPTKPSSRH